MACRKSAIKAVSEGSEIIDASRIGRIRSTLKLSQTLAISKLQQVRSEPGRMPAWLVLVDSYGSMSALRLVLQHH